MTIIKKNFGEKLAFLYELKNKNGMKVTLTNFGARIVDIFIPIDEHLRNISLSATSVEDYYQKDIYVGATVAPVAGRISGAKTHIKGKCYHFTENEPNRTLHSGVDTSVEQYWSTEIEDKENKIIFSLFLPDGKNGFPGNVTVIATYQLTEENELKVNYQAQSDCDTIFNPTNHVYFNLTGDFQKSVASHQLKISSQEFVPLGKDHLPTGEILTVEGTDFDFREFALFSKGLNRFPFQTRLVNGFDHPWLLEVGNNAVEVVSPDNKISLIMKTNQPAVVIYTYNHGPTALAACHGAFSLECQSLPNACNLENLGSILLEKGKVFDSHFSYRFVF